MRLSQNWAGRYLSASEEELGGREPDGMKVTVIAGFAGRKQTFKAGTENSPPFELT